MPVMKTDWRRNKEATGATADTNRTESPDIWFDCPWEEIQNGQIDGVCMFDDFTEVGFVSSTITSAALFPSRIPWQAFGSTGATHLPATAARNGTITLGSDGDDEAANMQTLSKPFQINQGEGKLWFECRLKLTTINVTIMDVFVGLAETHTQSATVPITATAGTLADMNIIGFQRPGTSTAGDGSLLQFKYKADGQAVATVGTKASAFAADTFIKLGFTYNPLTYVVEWYVNNLKQSSSYTVTSTAGNPFPNDVVLGPTLAITNTAGSITDKATIDWVRCAQLGTGIFGF